MLMQYSIEAGSASYTRHILSAFLSLVISLINLKLFLKTYFSNDASSVAARHLFPALWNTSWLLTLGLSWAKEGKRRFPRHLSALNLPMQGGQEANLRELL